MVDPTPSAANGNRADINTEMGKPIGDNVMTNANRTQRHARATQASQSARATALTHQQGAVVDIAYTHQFYPSQSPIILNYVGDHHGPAGINTDQPFRYCELGCGNRLTANTVAVALPQSQFISVDINATHIANVEFVGDSFENFRATNMAGFDFIALHGIYS
jgi:hypothetical protein